MLTTKLDKRMVLLFLISSIILILIVLGFTGGLNMASFQKSYTDSLVSSYAVSGGETVRKIEYALKYGKPLTNFYGIEELLQDKLAELPDIEEIVITLPDGEIIYNQFGAVMGEFYAPEVQEQVENLYATDELAYASVLQEGRYHVFVPLENREGSRVGSLVLIFEQAVVKAFTDIYTQKLIRYLLLLAGVAIICLLIFIIKVPIVNEEKKIRKKPILSFLLIILTAVQLIYGGLNYFLFKEAYLSIAQQNASFAAQVVQKDINTVINKGVPYAKLYRLEEYLQGVIAYIPEIESLSITDQLGALLYQTELNAESPSASGSLSELEHRLPLPADSTGMQGMIHVNISADYLAKHMREIILDMLTVFITSFIFMVEVTLFMIIFMRQKVQKSSTVPTAATKQTDAGLIRPVAFILFMAIFMSTSFIPIVMKGLYKPILGLSETVLMGLPISVEMFSAGLATVLAGYAIDRHGWRVVFFMGLFLFVLGTSLSATAWGPLIFVGARGTVGLGYGLALMSLRGYVNQAPTDRERTDGVAALFSGMYAGINCGVIVGAMLADRVDYAVVFIIALGVACLSALFAAILIQGRREKRAQKVKAVSARGQVLSFFSNGQVLLFFGLILIPTAICSMFLDYFFPVFADSIGASTSNVGRAFLLNGLCIVYLGPLLSRFTAKFLGIEKSIALAGLIVVGAMLFFASQGTLLAAFVAAILLGLADSFGLVAQNNYFLKLKASGALGVGKALGFYGNVRKLGQMLGPMVFGGVAMLGMFGIGVIGLCFLATIILFLFSLRQKRKQIIEEHTGVSH